MGKDLRRLQRWRQEFQLLPNDTTRDQHLSVIFWDRPMEELGTTSPPRDSTTSESEDDTGEATTPSATSQCNDAPKKRPLLHTDRRQAHPSSCRMDTTEESSDSSCDVEEEPKVQVQGASKSKRSARRQYNGGRTRKAARAVELFGHQVCFAAALAFTGVGRDRLYRIKDGLMDGRRDGTRGLGPLGSNPRATTTSSVLRFLWRLYHSVAEGMPDRFTFERRDIVTPILEPSGARRIRSRTARTASVKVKACNSESEGDESDAVDPEAQLRKQECAIASSILYAESRHHAPEAIQVGPGMLPGPLRFLPPGKRVELFWEYAAWCQSQGMPQGSLNTFLRVLRSVKDKLRIRKAGSHATCTVCAELKRDIRAAKSPTCRQKCLQAYTSHIMAQWLDRQVYYHAMDLSLSLREALHAGQLLMNMALSISQMCVIVDGIDQAKFRLPRKLERCHALDRLLRPALHVQGIWAHGFGYQLAVADADMKKDTNNNVEVIARMLSDIHDQHGGLPKGLLIQQDNTCRECKNQHIVKWAAKMVGLKVFQSVVLSYLVTGHTHENLDGTYGQICVKLSSKEFDDADEVVDILQEFLRGLGIDPHSRQDAKAYKLDEAAKWTDWWEELNLSLSQLTGPDAPHWFRLCCLKDLGTSRDGRLELGVPITSARGMPPESPDDIVMVVKERMSSQSVLQVLRLLPAYRIAQLCPSQPQGVHPRRPDGTAGKAVKDKVAQIAKSVHARGAISDRAKDYLVGWSQGSLPRVRRPERYSFLSHRFNATDPADQTHQDARPLLRRPQLPRVKVLLQGVSGKPLREEREGSDNDEADPGPLIEA